MADKWPARLKEWAGSCRTRLKGASPSWKWGLGVCLALYFFVLILWQVPQWQVAGQGLYAKDRLQAENEARRTLAQILGSGLLLVEAHLKDARLEKARLAGVRLKGAYLRGAHLERAFLRGAHLQGADFVRAHLEGANLGGAIGLTQAQINETFCDDRML